MGSILESTITIIQNILDNHKDNGRRTTP